IYEIILVIVTLLLLAFLLLTKDKNNLKAHCAESVCNEDYTICYKYGIDANGNQNITWKGNCSSLK
ncbi:MAG: hypothetical protein K2J20_06695, partial [Bacilli bacterium]|nr:hypothetical protein [Bacilli bacterium]